MSLNAVSIIEKKRDGQTLTVREITTLIDAYSRGEVPDYQMAALAMAIYCRGMSDRETAALTDAMLNSGSRLAWPDDGPPVVDKHSTGGVGDKVSLVLAPLLACCGVWVPMISGRGLGPTGGTLDKLESIPGFRTDLSPDELVGVTTSVGCAITGASIEIAPADRKLYALRDVTGTVGSVPLITASIMSKKLAEQLNALVLDVKCGAGAFMKTPDTARTLANSLISTGHRAGVATVAMITDMNQPLGVAIGNAIEVQEAVATLQGDGPSDVVEVTLSLGAQLLSLVDRVDSPEAGAKLLRGHLDSGRGYEKLSDMVQAQQGDLAAARPLAPESLVAAPGSGYVHQVDTEYLGNAVIDLGGGRRIAGEPIDHSVGLEILVRIGDRVKQGQPVIRVFAREQQSEEIRESLARAVSIRSSPVRPMRRIVEQLGVGEAGC